MYSLDMRCFRTVSAATWPERVVKHAVRGWEQAVNMRWRRLCRPLTLLLLIVLARPALAGPATPGSTRMPTPPSNFRPHVEVICIDDRTERKLGRVPLDRRHHAALVNKLVAAGARVIAFDLYFGSRMSPAGDKAFADAIRRSNRTWLIVEPTSAKKEEPILPLAMFASAARWRIAYGTVAEDLRFVIGISMAPMGKQKLQHLCVGLLSDYMRLRRWPYPNASGDAWIFNGWELPASDGMFTSDASNTKRLDIDADSWVRQHSYGDVVSPGYDMRKFKNSIVVVGATAQNVGEEYIFNNWHAPRWQTVYHVQAIGILVEKMLRYMEKPERLPTR
ncbi:MAG: CHASE2 domain-containing protein [Armatimonadetes bacterium]|nr:CHASE2 domain-containing protein [Armatimonadota bacterium]